MKLLIGDLWQYRFKPSYDMALLGEGRDGDQVVLDRLLREFLLLRAAACLILNN